MPRRTILEMKLREKVCMGSSPISNSTNEVAPTAAPLDWNAIRAKLNSVRGQDYWRTLDELAATAESQDKSEFPPGASEWWDGLSRRNFLRMAAATMALAGLNACTKQPTREIFPYVNQPPELVLGEPLYYATAMLMGGFATGVLAKSREGHPIKVDGNPEHPASLGGSSIWLQASILDLYDPDRSQTVLRNGDISSWALFLSDLNDMLVEQRKNQGTGMRFLTETVTSPTLAAQLDELLKQFPRAKWYQYDSISRDNVKEGARLAFGEIVEAQYRFDKAAVIVSLDSDFLYTHPMRLAYTRQFTDGRRISSGRKEFNRLYVTESSPTITGTMADHRLPLSNREIADLARHLAEQLGAMHGGQGDALPQAQNAWLQMVVQELQQHRGNSVVIAGEWQPPQVHALAHLLNESLGNVGKTVYYIESAEARPINQRASLRELVSEMKAGQVDTLFILGGNPVYSAPVELDFGRLLSSVKRSVHVGMTLDETAALCEWHIPQTHYLESWGDARAFDGTITFMQPLIAPVYGGKSVYEVLGAMMHQQPTLSDYEIVRDFWQARKAWPDFEAGWRKALHDGFVAGSQSSPKTVRPKQLTEDEWNAAFALNEFQRASEIESSLPPHPGHLPQGEGRGEGDRDVLQHVAAEKPASEVGSGGSSPTNLEICFRPDPSIWDGHFANNGWLQECPRPVSKLTWDNAILASPAMAERLKLSTGDVVELTFAERKLRGPVLIMPGQAEQTLTLHLGYGRNRVGRVGAGVGFNAGALRTMHAFWSGTGATLANTDAKHLLVTTQTHFELHSPERQVFRSTPLAVFKANPNIIKESVKVPDTNDTLYKQSEYPYAGYKWGMSIDLTTCIGCSACLVACEVENNIPVVGKDQVHKRREMFWIRIDTYHQGPPENPGFHHMPVPCMHCEHAPCELVCPVEATLHDHEGLNLQVYNRCVGTRFCSNNCPYKVRRFNFLRYSPYDIPHLEPLYNPEVTVRWRGVMEKCTYCIQRIAHGRITAEKENRRIRDGEVKTACQQACPANAIIFGDLNTPHSEVARLKSQPLDYPMLGELNTRPRTTYLARVQNPNPKAEG